MQSNNLISSGKACGEPAPFPIIILIINYSIQHNCKIFPSKSKHKVDKEAIGLSEAQQYIFYVYPELLRYLSILF